MWKLIRAEKFERDYKWYEKKKPRELRAVLLNLQSYFAALNEGTKPLQVQAGFLHVEQAGVVAIDQKGGHGAKLAQTRLYAYPQAERRELHLITIGDKNQQGDDVQFCKRYVDGLKKVEAGDDEIGQVQQCK